MIFATGKLLFERTSFFIANEERTRCEARCEEYTAIDMTVHSLAVWHSYLGLHARWVLGVRVLRDFLHV